jgi:hypothetical protein
VFLLASGDEGLIHNYNHNKKYPDAIHRKLLSLLRDFTIIGGMPQVVREYIETRDLS